MISTKTIKIEKTKDLTSEYVENELKKRGLNVLRWAITDYDENFFVLNIAVIED